MASALLLVTSLLFQISMRRFAFALRRGVQLATLSGAELRIHTNPGLLGSESAQGIDTDPFPARTTDLTGSWEFISNDLSI